MSGPKRNDRDDEATGEDPTAAPGAPSAEEATVGGTETPVDGPAATDESERHGGLAPSLVRDRERAGAALAYVLGPLTGVGVWLLARDSRYVRFHAVQSVLFALSVVLLFLGLSFVQFLLIFVPGIGELLSIAFSFAYVAVALVLVAVWLRLIYAARTATYYRLPLLGPYAQHWSGSGASA